MKDRKGRPKKSFAVAGRISVEAYNKMMQLHAAGTNTHKLNGEILEKYYLNLKNS